MRFLVRKLSQGVSAVVTLAASAGLLTGDTQTAQQVSPPAPAVAVATPATAPHTGQGSTALSGSAAQVAGGVSMTLPWVPVPAAMFIPPTPSEDR